MTRIKKLSAVLTLILIVGCFQQSLNGQTKSQEQVIANSYPGKLINLPGLITQNFPEISYDQTILPGPQYIISDDPEYIKVPEAIALKETVEPGSVRLYVYNVNGIEEPKIKRKITALLTNKGSHPLHFRMLKYSSQAPSTNYYKIGKEGLSDYFSSKENGEVITVQPGETISIDPQLEENIVQFNELVHGIYEFVVDQPAEINIVQTNPETPGPEALSKIQTILQPHSHSGAGRGKFGVSNYEITNKKTLNTNDGPVQLIVADGKNDPWVKGKEGVSGKDATLAGNYGVMYDINIDWKSPDGKALALVTWNSRSGNNKWCGGMAASILFNKEGIDECIVEVPSDNLVTRKAPEAVLIKLFKPDPDKEIQKINFTYSPPGASCLPTPLIFIPVDIK